MLNAAIQHAVWQDQFLKIVPYALNTTASYIRKLSRLRTLRNGSHYPNYTEINPHEMYFNDGCHML